MGSGRPGSREQFTSLGSYVDSETGWNPEVRLTVGPRWLSPEHSPHRSRTQMYFPKMHQPGWHEGGKCGATPVKVQSLGSLNTFHILLTCPEQEVHFGPLQPVPPFLKWYLHCSLFTVSNFHCQHCFLLETGDERIRHMIGVYDH